MNNKKMSLKEMEGISKKLEILVISSVADYIKKNKLETIDTSNIKKIISSNIKKYLSLLQKA